MNKLPSLLQTKLVADVMNPEVVTLPAFATMEEAANIFAESEISGAPIVDETNRCIGVLSTTDFARMDETEKSSRCQVRFGDDFKLVQGGSSEPFHIEHVATDCVSQHMTQALQTIDSRSSLLDAVRYMLGQHIHRLIVLGEYGRPVGVLSTLDILAALVGQESQLGATR
ncbi:MAG: CBS domain-containing protein [Planctomycetota bacterium]